MSVVTIAALKAKYQTGDFPTEQDFIDLIDTLENASISEYKEYVALMTQSGTSAPVATVIKNTLGGTIAWAYTDVGNYAGNLSGATMATGKTICYATPDDGNYVLGLYRSNTTQVFITTNRNDTGAYANNWLNGATVVVRVYT